MSSFRKNNHAGEERQRAHKLAGLGRGRDRRHYSGTARGISQRDYDSLAMECDRMSTQRADRETLETVQVQTKGVRHYP
jgi:hypothetical protein